MAKAKADSEKKTSTKSVAASKEEAVVNVAVEEPVTEKKEEGTEAPAEKPKRKRAPKKKAEEPKAEEAPAEEPKAETPKAAEEKPKKASTKTVDTAKKAAKGTSAKKADAKKEAEKVEEVYVQFQGQEIATKDIVDKVKQAYKDDGHRVALIKSIQIYIKP